MADDKKPGTVKRPAERSELGQQLHELRKDRDYTQARVARALFWSTAKVRTIEKGNRGISKEDLTALLTFYGVKNGDLWEELHRLAMNRRLRIGRPSSTVTEPLDVATGDETRPGVRSHHPIGD